MGVVLGCTEIELLVQQEHVEDVPVRDHSRRISSLFLDIKPSSSFTSGSFTLLGGLHIQELCACLRCAEECRCVVGQVITSADLHIQAAIAVQTGQRSIHEFLPPPTPPASL